MSFLSTERGLPLQGFHKRFKVRFLARRQSDTESVVVEAENLLQVVGHAVMHIWRVCFQRSEAGHLELADVFPFTALHRRPRIGRLNPLTSANVFKRVEGKVGGSQRAIRESGVKQQRFLTAAH